MSKKEAATRKVIKSMTEDLFIVDTVGDKKREKQGGKRKKRVETGPTEKELEELLFGESIGIQADAGVANFLMQCTRTISSQIVAPHL